MKVFAMRLPVKMSPFLALMLFGGIVDVNLNRHAIQCCYSQQAEIISQIEHGLASSINKLKTFRKVTFDNSANSGNVRIEISSENDNFAAVIRPTSNEGHYTTNVYASNEEYGFWLGKQDEGSDAMIMRSITNYQNDASRYDPAYAYGNLLKTLAESGMISCSIFCPFTYLRLSDPNCGVQSVAISSDSTDLYMVNFRPNLSDVTDKYGNVHNLSSIKSGRIAFSKMLGFLPVNGELQRSITLPNNKTENWTEQLEWTYEPFDGIYRLASFVYYRLDMPAESRIERNNFLWEPTLQADEFRITRFGFEEPSFLRSKWSVPFWFWLVIIGLFVVRFSVVLIRRRT